MPSFIIPRPPTFGGRYCISFLLVMIIACSSFLPGCHSLESRSSKSGRINHSSSITPDSPYGSSKEHTSPTAEQMASLRKLDGPCVQQLGEHLNRPDLNGDSQRKSIALSSDGNTVAVGVAVPKVTLDNGIRDSLSGFVEVFSYNDESADGWTKIGQTIDDEDGNVGSSLDLSGDGTRLIVGSPSSFDRKGKITLYSYNGTSERWEVSSERSGASRFNDEFGTSVAVSTDGTAIAGGGPGYSEKVGLYGIDTDVGMVAAFAYDEGAAAWVQKPADAFLTGKNEFAAAGTAVDLSADGSVVAFGLPGDGINDQGSVEVHEFDDDAQTWVKRGQSLRGDGGDNEFGSALSLSEDGNTVAVGAEKNMQSEYLGTKYRHAGYVRVYRYREETKNWVLLGARIDGTQYNARLGSSIALYNNGGGLVVGGVGYGRKPDGGSVGHGLVMKYEYDFDSNTWNKLRGSEIWGQNERDGVGSDVAVSSDGSVVALTGVFGEDETKVFRVFSSEACQVSRPPPGAFIPGNKETSAGTSAHFVSIAVALTTMFSGAFSMCL